MTTKQAFDKKFPEVKEFFDYTDKVFESNHKQDVNKNFTTKQLAYNELIKIAEFIEKCSVVLNKLEYFNNQEYRFDDEQLITEALKLTAVNIKKHAGVLNE